MRFLGCLLILLALLVAPAAHGQGTGTLTQMQQWVSTSSPSSAITQTVIGKPIKLTGLSTGLCLTLDTNSIVTTTSCGSGGGGSGTSAFEIATTSDIALQQVLYLTKTSGRTTVGSVATGTLSVPTGLTVTGNRYVLGGNASIALDTGYVIPLQSTLDAKALGATTITVNGTVNQLTSSAGAQDLSANRTWTLSLPNHVVFPSSFVATSASTTNATSTNQAITNLLTYGGVTGNSWDDFCVSITGSAALCDGDDASGAGGSGTSAFEVATTSDISVSQLAYFSKTSGRTTLASVATGTVSGTNGITVTAGRSAIGGALAIDCTVASGSAAGCLSNSDWTTFNGKESVLTFTAPLIRSGNTINWTGLATSSQPASSNLLVSNGGSSVYGVATSSASCSSGVSCSTFTVVGSVAPSITNTLTAGDNLTRTGDDIDLDATLLALTGITSTGAIDFGGAVLEISNGTNPTANDVGELAHDTTDNMLVLDDFIVGKATERIWGVTVASTSVYMISGTNLPVPDQADGYTMTSITCKTVSGTSVAITITDGSNATESITCDSDGATDDGTITNAAVTAGEDMYLDFGTVSGAVDSLTVSIFGQWTRE